MFKSIFIFSCLYFAMGNAIPDMEVFNNEVHCLTENIYHEARGEGIEGMLAVAYVTLNRKGSQRYPDSICEVVYQKSQFEWVSLGMEVEDLETYESIRAIVMVLGMYDDPTNGATHYYAHEKVTPFWASSLKNKRIIGNHTFGVTK